MAQLTDFLYFFTSGLIVPCIALLLFMLCQSLLMAGRCWLRFRKNNDAMNQLVSLLRQQDKQALQTMNIDVMPEHLQPVIKEIWNTDSEDLGDYLINEYEAEADKQLEQFTRFAKLGPILGLMGTLIPMGPALQGLASGDIAAMAGQMQVAFTTTVIGLLIGAIGFILFQNQRRLAVRELAALELLASRHFSKGDA